MKKLTDFEVYNQVFPVWTYSYFVSLLLFGLLSEWAGYKLPIVFGVLCNAVTVTLLLLEFTVGHLLWIQASEVTIGFYFSAMILFSSFIFVLVPSQHYLKIVSSHRTFFPLNISSKLYKGQSFQGTSAHGNCRFSFDGSVDV